MGAETEWVADRGFMGRVVGSGTEDGGGGKQSLVGVVDVP